MKNKCGKTGALIPVIIIVALVVVGILGYMAFTQTTTGGFDDKTGSGCALDPVITITDRSALPFGTDPSTPNWTASTDGGPYVKSVTSGSTSFAVGDKVKIFGYHDDYINTVSDEITIKCGENSLDFPMYYATSDNPTIRWVDDEGNYMTDAIAGGPQNQSNIGNGETLNLQVEIQGTAGESTGEGILVMEFQATSDTNISQVTLDGQPSISIPNVYTKQNAGSEVVAFNIPATEGGQRDTYDVAVTMIASGDMSGGVYTDWFTKQWFIDDDDTIAYGVQDSDGTAQYENSVDSDFFIDAS